MTFPAWLTRSKVTTALTALAGALISLQGALQLAPPEIAITIPPITFLVLGVVITGCVAINDALIKVVSGSWAGWLGLASSVLGAIAPQLSLISTRHGFYAMVGGLVIAGLGGPLMKGGAQNVLEAQGKISPDAPAQSGAELVEKVETGQLSKPDPRNGPNTVRPGGIL